MFAHSRSCSCSSFWWGPHKATQSHWCSCSNSRWGPQKAIHSRWCSCSSSWWGPHMDAHSRSCSSSRWGPHGHSCPFVSSSRWGPHGRSRSFVFLFPVRAAWSLTLIRVPAPGEGRMVAHARSCSCSGWGPHGRSLTLCSCAAWSLTPVRVPVPGEGHMVSHSFVFQFSVRITWSLMSRWCSSSRWGPYMVAHISWCSSLRWGLLTVIHSSTISGFLFQLTPTQRFRKGDCKGEDNVTDMTTTIPRFELLTICIIVKCYVLTNTSKYRVMLCICP